MVKLDVDDKKQYGTYYMILAVVYVNETNLNEKMVKDGYAEVMYIPLSAFDSREWEAEYIPSQSPMLSPTATSNFGLLFAIIGVVAEVYLVLRPGKAYW